MHKSAQKSRWSALFCGVILAVATANSSQATTYQSANGYQFDAPKSWQKIVDLGGSEILFRNSTGENINVVVRALPGNVSLAQVRAATIVQLRSTMNNYRLLAQGNNTLGGKPSTYITSNYTMGTPAVKLRAHQVFALRNHKIYVFTCTAKDSMWPRYAATFQTILKSVKWTR